jgi:hypothetical protein
VYRIMRPQLRATAAALVAGALLGLAASSGCSAQDCKSMKANGNPFAGLLCGGAGIEAPEPKVPPLSLCQPREVMPVFFSLIDHNDPSLAGLRGAMADLGRPLCLIPKDRTCTSDDQCAVGRCAGGLCPCQTSYSPLTDVLGVTLRAMAAIAKDPVEAAGLAAPGCLSPARAKDLPADKRSRICELRRMLDILLQSNGGSSLVNDADIRKVVLSLLDYVQGKTDPSGASHYDLLAPIGRMAGAHTASCDPAALWTLLDNMLGYLTPAAATAQLGALQVLLADPYTRTFLASFAGKPGPQARDAVIVLANALSPAITSAASGQAALAQVKSQLLDPFVYNSSSVPQSFKDEVKAVMTNASALLADSTGIFPPLKKVVACVGSPEVRCADAASCSDHKNELIGALYDVLSLPEAQGGVDLATLVGALKSLTTLDQTGQTGRALRLVVRGIAGCPTISDQPCVLDPNGTYEARDAVASLASSSLTAQEGQKLLPALSVLIEKQVVGEFVSLLHDLLYTCSPPPATH